MTGTTSSVDSVWHEATPAQRGLWIIDQIDRLRPSYLLPSVVELRGPLDHGLLVTAVTRALGRHPALRARFRLDPVHRRVEYHTGGESAEAGLIDAEADGWSPDDLERLVEALCYTPFELGQEPPARAEVIRLDDRTTLLVLSVHHIVFDGWSRQVLLAEMAETYRAGLEGREPVLPPAVHPADVTVLPPAEEAVHRRAEAVERLRGAPTDIALPYDGDRDADTAMLGVDVATELDEPVSAALLAVAERHGCTPFMAGVAALVGTLARSGAQRDFLIAVVWPGRDDPATANAVGMFMTTVILRLGLACDTTWSGLLRRARIAALEAFFDADVPLDTLAAALDPDRSVSRPPLSPVLVNAAESLAPIELAGGVHGRYLPLRPQYSKWDLAVFIGAPESSRPRRVELRVDHPAELFTRSTVIDILAALRRSARDLALTPEECVLKPELDDPRLADPDARLELVRSVWREVLEVTDVDDDVSFFDAGGDSMRLVILVERLGQESGRSLRTIDLFRAGTIRGQADLIGDAAERTAAPQSASGSRERLLNAVRGRREDTQS